jgi:hypothetical protein
MIPIRSADEVSAADVEDLAGALAASAMKTAVRFMESTTP